MVDEIDKIVKNHPELYRSRQMFIETAIVAKIERVKFMNSGLQKDALNGKK